MCLKEETWAVVAGVWMGSSGGSLHEGSYFDDAIY
jgi:hypothetical protein